VVSGDAKALWAVVRLQAWHAGWQLGLLYSNLVLVVERGRLEGVLKGAEKALLVRLFAGVGVPVEQGRRRGLSFEGSLFLVGEPDRTPTKEIHGFRKFALPPSVVTVLLPRLLSSPDNGNFWYLTATKLYRPQSKAIRTSDELGWKIRLKPCARLSCTSHNLHQLPPKPKTWQGEPRLKRSRFGSSEILLHLRRDRTKLTHSKSHCIHLQTDRS
jgi:hypothetical protein